MTRRNEIYDALLQYARDEIRAHQLERGEAIARQALSLLPERAAAYNILAVVQHLRGLSSEAMDLLLRGIAVEPSYEPAQENWLRLGSFPPQSTLSFGDEEDAGTA